MINSSLKKGFIGLIMLALGSFKSAATASTTFYYSVTDLGTLGSGYSYAYGLNDSGQVVGYSSTSSANSGNIRAFRWDNGTMTNLGTLDNNNSQIPSRASAINILGQVVGYSDTNSRGTQKHAFRWNNPTMTDLGTLGGNQSSATSINNQGQIVGNSDTTTSASSSRHAFMWNNGTMIDLGTLGGKNSYATAINNAQQVVGYSMTSSGSTYTHAFVWRNGQITDLGTLGGRTSFATGINDQGQIVGNSDTSNGRSHCFKWSNGTMLDLTSHLDNYRGLNCQATGINNRGTVVGNIFPYAGSDPNWLIKFSYPFVSSNGSIIPLNKLLPPNSGWVLQKATAINNYGQIIGHGIQNGQKRAFLLTPTRVTQ